MQSGNECLQLVFRRSRWNPAPHAGRRLQEQKLRQQIDKIGEVSRAAAADLTLSTHGSELDEAAWRQAGRSHAPDEQRAIERWKKPTGGIAPPVGSRLSDDV